MNTTKSTLHNLRCLLPQRPVSYGEAITVAEHQANRLAALLGAESRRVDEADLTALTRMGIERVPGLATVGTSGHSRYQQGRWVISIDGGESLARQRFTIAHEVKHIIDSARPRLYAQLTDAQVERVCEHFAGCLLMSKRAVYRLWGEGVRTPEALALACRVSVAAMVVRLRILRLPINSGERQHYDCRRRASNFPPGEAARSLPRPRVPAYALERMPT